MREGYLGRCLALYAETMLERYGSRPDHAALEKQLEAVRTGKRDFSYRDLETIQNPRYGDFRQFWRFPAEGEIGMEIDLAHMSPAIQRLPLDEAETIGRLHAAFKYIQNVSVVLRFIHPRHYGILSAPVEKVLEVRRGRTEVDTYIHYLNDIREIRDRHGFERTADVDMALWVLQERVLSAYRDPELLAAYRADTWLHRRRAVNLLAGFDNVDDRLELARALAEVNTVLASMIAVAEFDLRMREALDVDGSVPLGAALERRAGRLEPERVEHGRSGLRLRDRMRDPKWAAPSRDEIHELIDRVRRIAGPAP